MIIRYRPKKHMVLTGDPGGIKVTYKKSHIYYPASELKHIAINGDIAPVTFAGEFPKMQLRTLSFSHVAPGDIQRVFDACEYIDTIKIYKCKWFPNNMDKFSKFIYQNI